MVQHGSASMVRIAAQHQFFQCELNYDWHLLDWHLLDMCCGFSYLAEQSSLSCSGGDLYEELKQKGGRFEEARTAALVLRPCISALMYLHSQVCLSHTLYSCHSSSEADSLLLGLAMHRLCLLDWWHAGFLPTSFISHALTLQPMWHVVMSAVAWQ